MLRKLTDLIGYVVEAKDGNIGTVHDFLFDDQRLVLRYMVVDTGPWIFGRKVLIAPLALGRPDWLGGRFPVALTREQVKSSPDVDLQQPVSRQQEAQLRRYYQWPTYWTTGVPQFMPVSPPITKAESPSVEDELIRLSEESGDPHLRSVREVTGYSIQAQDGEIGKLDDIFMDEHTWRVHYFLVDTRKWLPGRKVVISPNWIDNIRWAGREVIVHVPKEQIKNSPEYDPNAPLDAQYESKLRMYYETMRAAMPY